MFNEIAIKFCFEAINVIKDSQTWCEITYLSISYHTLPEKQKPYLSQKGRTLVA